MKTSTWPGLYNKLEVKSIVSTSICSSIYRLQVYIQLLYTSIYTSVYTSTYASSYIYKYMYTGAIDYASSTANAVRHKFTCTHMKNTTNCARYSSSTTYLQYFFVYRISCLSLDISLPLRVFALVREQVDLDVSIWKGTPSIGAG